MLGLGLYTQEDQKFVTIITTSTTISSSPIFWKPALFKFTLSHHYHFEQITLYDYDGS